MQRVARAMTRIICLLIAVVSLGTSFEAYALTCTSQSSGNWNAAARWSCGRVPQAVDVVIIANGHAITVDTAAVGASLDMSAGNATTSVTINAGQSLTISGSVNISAVAFNNNNRNKTLAVGSGSLTIGGNLTLTGGSTASRTARLTITTGTATIGGSINIGGAIPAACNITFTNNGTLNVGGNFGNGATFTASTGTVVYSGSVNQDVGSYAYYNLTLSGSGTTKAATGGMTVDGTFTNGAGVTFDAGSFTHNLGGNLSNSGTFVPGSSTFNFDGTANQTITGATDFNNLTFANTGAGTTVNVGAFVHNVQGNFTNNGTFRHGTGTIVFNGAANQTITGATTFNNLTFANSGASTTVSAGAFTHNIQGNFSNNGTFAPSTGTIVFNGAANQTITGATTFNNLTFANTGVGAVVDAGASSHNVRGNFSNNGTFSPSTGTIVFNGTANQTITGATTFNNLTFANTGGGTTVNMGAFAHNIQGNFTNNGTFNPGTGTIVFNGTANQIITGATTFNHLTFANTGTSTTVDAGTASHNVRGNFSNNGSFAAGNGTMVFNGTVNQTITGPSTFHNLTINNTGVGLSLNSTITVNNQLALLRGLVNTGANKVSIGAAGGVTDATVASYVFGNMEKSFSAAGPFTFDIGDATNYTPVQVDFTTLTTAGTLTASTTAGDHPQIATSSLDSTSSVNRFWTLASSTIVGIYNAIFNFVAGDVDGGANTANFSVQRNASGGWFNTILNAANATSTSVSGVDGFGDFAIGEPVISSSLLEREVIYVQEVFN